MKRTAAKQNKFVGLLAGLLCLLLLSPAALAANLGSLQVTVEDAGESMTMTLCRVSEADGTLVAAFSGTGLSRNQLLNEEDRPASATILYNFAMEQGLSGTQLVTDENGAATFDGLEEGIYLIWGQSETMIFKPFLVSIPTVVDGAAIYDVEAKPKTENPDKPLPPDETTPPETPPVSTDPPTVTPPDIPQTGVVVWPIYLLLALGILVVSAGVVIICRGRNQEDEEDALQDEYEEECNDEEAE